MTDRSIDEVSVDLPCHVDQELDLGSGLGDLVVHLLVLQAPLQHVLAALLEEQDRGLVGPEVLGDLPSYDVERDRPFPLIYRIYPVLGRDGVP